MQQLTPAIIIQNLCVACLLYMDMSSKHSGLLSSLFYPHLKFHIHFIVIVQFIFVRQPTQEKYQINDTIKSESKKNKKTKHPHHTHSLKIHVKVRVELSGCGSRIKCSSEVTSLNLGHVVYFCRRRHKKPSDKHCSPAATLLLAS